MYIFHVGVLTIKEERTNERKKERKKERKVLTILCK